MAEGGAQHSERRSRAEELFAAFLAEHGAEGAEPEALLETHPELAGELGALLADWQRVRAILPDLSGAGPPDGVLGAEDPLISLEEEGDLPSVSAAVLEELGLLPEPRSRYRPKGELARGGMGSILHVWDGHLRRNIAMKMLLAPRAQARADEVHTRNLSRFLEEAQITGQLDHPGIVPVHELGLDARGRVYFTMKLVRGRDLREIIRLVHEGLEDWTRTRAVQVVQRVCEALSYAHAKGVIHRDVKPANVMVGKYGEVYLMDWGLARVAGREDSRDLRLERTNFVSVSEIRTVRREAKETGESSPLVTVDGTIVGTPHYMSPEQAEGRLEDVGPASDVYGVGTLLYQLLCGAPPYYKAGARLSQHTVLAMVLQGPPPAVGELAPEAPRELVAICEKAMARDPAERYPSALELGQDLRRYLDGRVVRAYEHGPAAELRKWVARNRPLALTVAGSVAALLAGSLGWSLVLAGKNTDLEQARRTAEDAQGRAEVLQASAERERDELLQLSDVHRVQELVRQANGDLWPALSHQVPKLETWLADAEEVLSRVPVHERAVEALHARALPPTHEDREADRAEAERLREIRRASLELHLGPLRSHRESWLYEEMFDPEWEQPAPEDHVALHEAELARLAEEPLEIPHRSYRFASMEDGWKHDLLEQLLAGARSLTEPFGGLVASVRERLEVARTIRARSLASPAAAAAWLAAVEGVASHPLYGGHELEPIEGLLPLGPDPDSGLWEFAALLSGEAPARDAEGRLVRGPESAIVLVLVPGGLTVVGAQNVEPRAANYDPDADEDDVPTQQAVLDPFLVAKHETTQAQWERAARENPSSLCYRGVNQLDLATELSPAETVSWEEARAVLARLDLELPTEVQWEHACRAGSPRAWYTGDDPQALRAHEHLLWGAENSAHLPTGSLLPNAFGLHDMLGNVMEWCRDGHSAVRRMAFPRPGDGERVEPISLLRVVRGGSAWRGPHESRCAAREPERIETGGRYWIGVRAARSLRP